MDSIIWMEVVGWDYLDGIIWMGLFGWDYLDSIIWMEVFGRTGGRKRRRDAEAGLALSTAAKCGNKLDLS